MAQYFHIDESPAAKFVLSNTWMAWFWLIVRLYVGWEWFSAGWEKFSNPAWFGRGAGSALEGFLNGAFSKSVGAHPDVQGWYATFLRDVVLIHPVIWSNIITMGELAVGIALILGLLTGIAAFFGLFMNLNYLLAGTVSTNPILFVLAIGIILAWRIAGYFGLDYFLLPFLGTPWQKVGPPMPPPIIPPTAI